ncbi:MAG: anion permease [Lachnospiraceae bacterium]|nr:anion permease [Lachnospiraceae bacterium]
MLSLEQIAALVIFIGMFVLIVSDRIPRQRVTLVCAALTIGVVFGLLMRNPSAIQESLNLGSFFRLSFWYTNGKTTSESAGINWATILFVAGMMIMVEGMAKSGFFHWLCMWLAKLVKYRPIPLLISFMTMSFILAMFIDSITVILFLAAVTVELAKLLSFDPVPMILSEIFCANLGGSATMCGDPPNIIIGTALHYSFIDFVRNTGLIAFVNLLVVILYFYLVNRQELAKETISPEDIARMPSPESAIKDRKDFVISCIIFATAVCLLVTHSMTGLTVACIGTFIAVVTLAAAGRDAGFILSKVDYETLLFFVGLFVVVSGLELTGLLNILAEMIGDFSGGSLRLMVAFILWFSAIASAIVDNIPFAATMVPVIRMLASTQQVELNTLAWTLAIGTDVGGSATPIGASANVVGTSVAMKNGYMIGWGKYCKMCLPATVIVIFLSMLFIFLRYC